MNHFLFWDMSDERRLPYALADRYPEFMITPMSYAATLTCRQYFADHYLPFETIVPSSEREKLFSESNSLIDRFYAGISPKAPSWCRALPAKSLAHSIYYTLLAHLFMTNAVTMHPGAHFVLYRPLALSLMPNLSRAAYHCFREVLAAHSYASTLSRREKVNRLLSRVMAAVYPAQARQACDAKQASGKQHAHTVAVDILLVALEESDRRNQTPLIEKLSARSDVSVHWLAVEGDHIGQSADELHLSRVSTRALSHTKVNRDFVSEGGEPVRFKRVKKWAAQGWYYQACRYALGEHLPAVLCWRLAMRLAGQEAGLERSYRAVQRLLGTFTPKVMVVNSFLQSMRSVQLEAERRSIPLVLLPHGVSDLRGPEAHWRADAVGRFGRLEQEILADQFPERRDTLHAVGGGHMGQLAMHQGAIQPDWPEGRLTLLFPTTIPRPFKPHSPLEIMEDAETLVRAGLAVGAKTLVRCHPRQKHHNYFDYEMMLEKIDASGWALSDGADSLVERLRACHIVVISHYSGATLQALYAPRPIVCWMPRPYTPFSDQILGRFPCRAVNQDELVAAFQKIVQDPDYRAELIQQQQTVLAELVEEPQGDPYAGQERLVLETLERVKSEG